VWVPETPPSSPSLVFGTQPLGTPPMAAGALEPLASPEEAGKRDGPSPPDDRGATTQTAASAPAPDTPAPDTPAAGAPAPATPAANTPAPAPALAATGLTADEQREAYRKLEMILHVPADGRGYRQPHV
jgi:hypothetical protein